MFNSHSSAMFSIVVWSQDFKSLAHDQTISQCQKQNLNLGLPDSKAWPVHPLFHATAHHYHNDILGLFSSLRAYTLKKNQTLSRTKINQLAPTMHQALC